MNAVMYGCREGFELVGMELCASPIGLDGIVRRDH